MLLFSFFFFPPSQSSSEGVTHLERCCACIWLPRAVGLSTAKENGFTGFEYLQLFLTTVSSGVTCCGEHLLLLLRLPGCALSFFSQVWYLTLPAMASQCGSRCWDLWNTSQYGKAWERPELATCPSASALFRDATLHKGWGQMWYPGAHDPAYDLSDTRAITLLLSHCLFHPRYDHAECCVYWKTHGHSTAEGVSYWIFCGGNSSFIKS